MWEGRRRRGGMWEGEERWNVGGKGEALSLIKKLRHVQFGGQGKAVCMWGAKECLVQTAQALRECKADTKRSSTPTEARSGHTLSSTPTQRHQ